MNRIVTTSEVQQKIGQITKSIDVETYIVTSHGKGKMILLPYFDGCDKNMADYMEDYEMMKNQGVLQKRYSESSGSGESSLII
ncbi:hypothetical protein HON58_02020 [Candidatus Peregrinibacteria bacterium]|jgi:hypothetical protein|nr:hypothetical protein [Candidatus Peregrinibacteria bacterium]